MGQAAWEAGRAFGLHSQPLLLMMMLVADLRWAAEAAVNLPAAPAVLQ